MSHQSRGRRIVGWAGTVLLTTLFVASAAGKLLAAPPVVEMFGKWGLSDHRILIGVGELISALLFLIPITHSLGVLLPTAYIGGAIVTHMQQGEPYVAQALILVGIWVTAFLRHAEVLESFRTVRMTD